MSFKALAPGLYVYYCATPMVAEHIANGMYGLILVEPEQGLPKVDHEFYVMQGEIYTDMAFGQHGSHGVSVEKLLNERPEYFVFNGSVGAISKLHPLRANVGDTVRVFFGVGGPNFTSSFHVIGEIFDEVYNLGDVVSPPHQKVQTVTVPAGGSVITEFTAPNGCRAATCLPPRRRSRASAQIFPGSGCLRRPRYRLTRVPLATPPGAAAGSST
jgi:nitrite reductase (NO-forming)